jgi:hypothetical protein
VLPLNQFKGRIQLMFEMLVFCVRFEVRLSHLIAENHSRKKMSLSNRGRASVRSLHYLRRMHECELAVNAVWVAPSSSSHVVASTHNSTCHKTQSM